MGLTANHMVLYVVTGRSEELGLLASSPVGSTSFLPLHVISLDSCCLFFGSTSQLKWMCDSSPYLPSLALKATMYFSLMAEPRSHQVHD